MKPWESSYAAFSNSPILYNDPNGANAEKGKDKKEEKKKVTVNVFGANDVNGADKPSMYDYNSAQAAAKNDPSIINVTVKGGIKDIAKELKKLSKKYDIQALYLYGHGSTTDPSFGFNGIYYNNIEGDELNIRNFKGDLNEIGNSISSKAIIGVLGCGTGQLDENNDNSFIGTIAKETNRTTFAAQGIVIGGNAYTNNPLSEVDFSESWEFGQKMHQGTPWYTVAKPSIKTSKGYEISQKLFLSINPHGKVIPLLNKESLEKYKKDMYLKDLKHIGIQ